MEHKSIDITRINEIPPSMKAYYLCKYICDHIDKMPAHDIRKIILKNYHVNDLYPIKVAFSEVAMELGINFYRNKGNLEATATSLKNKGFEDEIVAEVIQRIGKHIRHSEANLRELYFKKFFPGILTLVLLYFVFVLIFRESIEYFELELLHYSATFVLSSIAFLLVHYSRRKTSRRILGL